MKLYKFIYLFFLIPFSFFSQVGLVWEKFYNGPANNFDQAYSITSDTKGNVYVTGFSTGNGSNYDLTTIKYNNSGNQEWVTRYNGPGNGLDVGFSITTDLNSNVYVTGSSVGNGTSEDAVTIKYNESGIEQWVSRFNGTSNNRDAGYSIVVDTFGNVYVTGYSRNTSTNDDFLTIKYNSFGVEQWANTYNYSGLYDNYAIALILDNNMNVYTTGPGLIGSNSDYVTVKYNSTGTQQWVKIFNGSGNNTNEPKSITHDNEGNILVTGKSSSFIVESDIITIKYTSNGDTIWTRRFNSTPNSIDEGISVQSDFSGNVYVGGTSNEDFIVLKYSPNGVLLWSKINNSSGFDKASDMDIDSFGNVYISGSSTGLNSGKDFLTLKYNSTGDILWIQRYTRAGESDEFPIAMSVSNDFNIFITGFIVNSYSDFATIKYSQTIGISQISTEIPSTFLLKQNYPNPFNPVTNIEFNIPKASIVRISVYDLLGREIETLVFQNLNAGSYKVDWDASKYSSGIYYYKITAGSYTETKKMVLVK